MIFVLLFISISVAVLGQFLLKLGVTKLPPVLTLEGILKTLFSPYVFLGLTMYALSAVLWLFVLKKLPLSVAYPTLSLSYLGILALSALFLGEAVTPTKVLGVFLIMGGVVLLYWQTSSA